MPKEKKIDAFEVGRKLGEGSFGGVWACHKKADPSLRYALKRVPLQGLSEKERQAALDEVSHLKLVSHSPFTLSVSHAFIEEGALIILTELCDGSLKDLIRELSASGPAARFSEQDLWRISLQVLLGLQSIHAAGLVHRDIKADNVMVLKDGKAGRILCKIGDFGVARVLQTGQLASTYVGTPLYLSPEAIANAPYSAKSDIWAYGVLLLELFHLRHPFAAARNIGSLAMMVKKCEYILNRIFNI
jgi:serine/threonine protein kinase